MEVTILDADGNRYDPEILKTTREPGRFFLTVKHADPVPFSQGDRVRIVIASDTYRDRDLSEIVKERKELEMVAGVCRIMLTDVTSQWEITQVAAVDDVLDADDSCLSITTFD